VANTDTNLQDNYAGVFDGKLMPGKRGALLIVDVVMAYLDPESPLYAQAEEALASNQRLVAAARAASVPVIFTNVEFQAGGKDGGLFYRKVPALSNFLAGSPLGRFPDTLQPAPGEVVVTKQYASSFFGTTLASTLTAQGIDTLLITGFSTSGCVRASALDALQHGFAPFVIRDACADRHSGPHEANLFDLQAKYAEVIGETEAIAMKPQLGMSAADN
jgi:maleamate amidohydrolase